MAEEDIKWGKNRHIFGGIEPSNMLTFSAEINSDLNGIKIVACPPNDTVVNDQTLCTVAGAVIRRRIDNYPKDEFDGDEVAMITDATEFIDSDVDITGTYYYAAFPFTTQGVYNRNTVNRVVVNEPADMVTFTAVNQYDSYTDTCTIKLTINIPENVEGVVVRRSTTGYPVNEKDGETFLNVTSDGEYTDSNVTIGNTYFYSAFTYTSTGAYNRNPVNRTSCNAAKYKYFYGYDIDLDDPNPATRVSYPNDVDNASYAPAKMDYTSSSFNYGGWPSTPGEGFMPKPCMLTLDGVVDQYLDPNDYSKTIDGIASKVADTSFEGNAMMEWPKIFTKRWEENGVYHFRCSDIKIDDDWECWCNYDKNDRQIGHFYTAIYESSYNSTTHRTQSISGVNMLLNFSFKENVSHAEANGSDWHIETIADRLLIQDLLVLMAKNTNTQMVYGNGISNDSQLTATGYMNTNGLFYGSNNYSDRVKIFGMENWWGNTDRGVSGLIALEGSVLVKLTRGTHDGSTASDYNNTGDGYISLGSYVTSTTVNFWISSMITKSYGRFPILNKEILGSSSTYEADKFYIAYDSDSHFASISGGNKGNAQNGAFVMGFYFNVDDYPNSGLATALSCKPSAK